MDVKTADHWQTAYKTNFMDIETISLAYKLEVELNVWEYCAGLGVDIYDIKTS